MQHGDQYPCSPPHGQFPSNQRPVFLISACTDSLRRLNVGQADVSTVGRQLVLNPCRMLVLTRPKLHTLDAAQAIAVILPHASGDNE